MDFAEIEAEFASHIQTVAAGKVAAAASRRSTKVLIALLPAYEAAYRGNDLSFSAYVAEKYSVDVRTVNAWRAAPAKAAQRKEAHRIRMALKRAEAKLKAHKGSAPKDANKQRIIRAELVDQAIILYADMTPPERTAFATSVFSDNNGGAK